jgi:DNA/RNA-binding domain of Phe-tRNA-synthetase-like protein
LSLVIAVEPHPRLALAAFTTELPAPLEACPSIDPIDPAALGGALLQRTEVLRAAVRDLLRYGGYKPTGRGKPASEYLVQAAERGAIGSINLAVDVLNLVSLHGGLPISVVDLDRCALACASTGPALRVAIAGDERYVFNVTGQTIELRGLLCLFDAEGPCASPVKDSQRTKTGPATRHTLSLVWAPADHLASRDAIVAVYRATLERAGARTEEVVLPPPDLAVRAESP